MAQLGFFTQELNHYAHENADITATFRVSQKRQRPGPRPKGHGIPVRYWEWFRLAGTKLRSGFFESGAQIGEWTTYDQQGQKYKVTHLKPKPQAAKATALILP